MMSPLKLSVIVCGAAAGLAVAPYVVKQILPPVGSAEVTSNAPEAGDESPVKLDLPVAGPNNSTEAIPSLALAAPIKQEPPARPELHLAAPALPVPAPVKASESAVELTLPSLTSPKLASTMPSPSFTPAPPPRPSPTPEMPYRGDVETAQKLMRDLGLNTGKIDGKLGPNTKAALANYQAKEGLTPSGDVTQELLTRMKNAVAALPAPTPAPEPKVIITDSENAKPAEKVASLSDADEPDAVVVRKTEQAKADQKVKIESAKPKVNPGPVPTLQNKIDVKKLQEQLKQAGTYAGDVDGKWGDLTRSAMRDFQGKAGIEVTGKPNKETWLAMHSGIVAPTGESVESEKSSTSNAVASADNMQISGVDSEIAASGLVEEETVVNVNGDGVSDPGNAKPIPTPSSVSDLTRKVEKQDKATEVAAAGSDRESPAVKVSSPQRNAEKVDKEFAELEEPNDLAVAEVDREDQMEKLRKEIEDKRAQILSVGNDSTYEVKKYAPKMLETVNNMVDNLKIESVSNDPVEARLRLDKIDEELEKAKRESMKKKAGDMVAEVRESYDQLKAHFPERIKSLSLKNDEEKTRREELTELVARCDVGFEAMEKDFKNGKYDPIFDNGVKFRATIDDISTDVAEVYVEKKLEQRDVKKKLKEADLKEIKTLQSDENHVKAAEVLEQSVSSGSKKKS